ncbi:MAG: GIY-YIG nuclease family protein [Verrucomicrobiae bacterium]|nr:GIY-YIG nuclease family protein [Verrucomicrobiae bacterium]
MFTTYGIVDPRTRLFVYIGQTKDFEARKKQHLAAFRLRKPVRGSVKWWLKRLHQDGLEPIFIVLEVVETEAESLESESKWVEKISRLGHPLLNRWEEHKDLIEAAGQGTAFDALLFEKGTAPQRIGRFEANANRSGYRFHLDEGTALTGPVSVDFLPPKKH